MNRLVFGRRPAIHNGHSLLFSAAPCVHDLGTIVEAREKRGSNNYYVQKDLVHITSPLTKHRGGMSELNGLVRRF